MKILPCPFCGLSNVSVAELKKNRCRVECNMCGAMGPTYAAWFEDGKSKNDAAKAAAIAKWNELNLSALEDRNFKVA